MPRIFNYTTQMISAGLILLAVACGESKKETAGQVGDKTVQLQKLKAERDKITAAIEVLEEELAQLNPEQNAANAKLVAVTALQKMPFEHYIELQGRIDADNISIVTPRGNPGQVKNILVKKGDMVKKGQLLLQLDDAIYQQNIRASRESIETLRTQLSLASELLKRQQNLWEQGIGTEVQLLTAKNNVATLNNQIKGAEEQVKVLQEQQKTTNVYAEVNGMVDEVNVRVGEFFQGAVGTMPQIRIVNTASLKLVTNIPENYVSKVNKGSKITANIPDLNRNYNTAISFISSTIDPSNRAFETEAKLPSDGQLKPNMVAIVKILDYAAASTIVVPVNAVQSDEKGKFVFVYATEGNKTVARKKQVATGMVQGSQVEIIAGLGEGEQLITEGYQGLYDGQSVKTVIN